MGSWKLSEEEIREKAERIASSIIGRQMDWEYLGGSDPEPPFWLPEDARIRQPDQVPIDFPDVSTMLKYGKVFEELEEEAEDEGKENLFRHVRFIVERHIDEYAQSMMKHLDE